MVVQVALDRAAKLVGRLAYNRAVKEAVRDAQVWAFCTHMCQQICIEFDNEVSCSFPIDLMQRGVQTYHALRRASTRW